MMTTEPLLVRPLPDDWAVVPYHLAIGTIGYERRARYVFDKFGPRGSIGSVACGFTEQQVLAYDENADWFREGGFSIDHKHDSEYAAWLAGKLDLLRNLNGNARILVDISSLTRVRLAHLIEQFRHAAVDRSIEVTFIYSLAVYTPPTSAAQYNSHVGPVTSAFAGWWEEPDRAAAAIVGLGYEEDKALGAVEHLQSSYVWLFVPTSKIGEYSDALARANRTLLEIVPPARQIGYRVHDPHESFIKLESLIYGVSRSHNAVLLPFGPKLFALYALLVGALHPNVAVWRVSAEGLEEPVDREGSGLVYGLQVEFVSPELELPELD